jgi:hypothetical protein
MLTRATIATARTVPWDTTRWVIHALSLPGLAWDLRRSTPRSGIQA